MIEWLIFSLPWWVKLAGLAVLALIGIYFAAAIFGWQRVRPLLLPALGILAAIGLANRWQQEGWKAREKKELEIANKHIERARKARDRAAAANADPGRLRQDDGFRRR